MDLRAADTDGRLCLSRLSQATSGSVREVPPKLRAADIRMLCEALAAPGCVLVSLDLSGQELGSGCARHLGGAISRARTSAEALARAQLVERRLQTRELQRALDAEMEPEPKPADPAPAPAPTPAPAPAPTLG